MVSVYGPGSERSREERLGFWECLERVLLSFGVDQKVCVMGDMNAKVGDREVRGVVGGCGVEGRNENGESLIELCLGRGLKVMNTYFRKRNANKVTWMSEINGEGALIDYICVSKRECERVVDVSVRRGAGGGLSDHYLVVGKVKIKKGWRREGRNEGEEVIKVWKLEEEEGSRRFEGLVGEVWERVRGEEWGRWRKSGAGLKV